MGSKLAHSRSVLSVYRAVARLGHRLPLATGALRASNAGRHHAAERWTAWAERRPPAGPLVWAHAASIGEQQVLAPVARRLVRARPDLTVVLTHTSPSVLHTAVPAGVCHRDYLPLDEPGPVAHVLDALRPALFLSARGDLWPELATAVIRRGIPLAVAGATVRQTSHRLHPVVRGLLGPVHAQVAWIGAVTQEDAERWTVLGVPADRVAVTGDPRHDHILERIPDLRPAAAVRAWAGERPVVVAGSVEASDDDAVLAGLTRLGAMGAELRSIVVPHDPTERRVAALQRRAQRYGLRCARWSASDADAAIPDAPVVLGAARGILADLYVGGAIAYVGGGFRHGRLHAVAEPAAVGLPLLVGPRWKGSPDAGPMVAGHGASVVGTANELAGEVARLTADPVARARHGLAARATLNAGGASRSSAALLRFLGEESRSVATGW